MSEQLTLDGLSNESSSEERKAGSSKPKKVVKSSAALPGPKKGDSPRDTSPRDTSIEERINALIEQKNNEQKAKANEAERTTEVLSEKVSIGFIDKTKQVAVTGFVEEAKVVFQASAPLPEKSQVESRPIPQKEVPPPPAPEAEPEVLTVSGLNRSIKTLLEKSYPFLWVKGEISNFKVPGSGHMYFTLKDSQSQIRAIMFRGFAQALKFKPEDGMEILVRCRVTAYEPRGDYQLFCEVMEPVGYGALQIAFEKLKEKLQLEGLFDEKRKRIIPAFPSRIGIITSPTGAAIRDMINVLSRRSGGSLDITILPASVQGDKAPGEIVRQIELANRLGLERFDVLIIGRGGGSLEDLWAFNMEEVVRAVAKSKIPTISAVGHEVDFTICDFVADLRAPTPSAAAELVVKNKKDMVDKIQLIHRHLVQQMQKKIQFGKAKAEATAKRLIDPKRRLQDLMLRCDEWSDRLLQSMQRFLQDNQTAVKFLRERLGSPEKRLELWNQRVQHSHSRIEKAMDRVLENQKSHLSKLSGLLNGLSPLAILGRGYSIVKKGSAIIKEAGQVKKGDLLTIKLHDGEINSEVK